MVEIDSKVMQRDVPGRLGALPERAPRVLVVDDDATTRRAHSRAVRLAGARTETAADGLEAVAWALRAADENDPFDLIVMDLEMPVVDGWGAAATLRARGFAGSIVAVSGCVALDLPARCAAAGIDRCVSKPTRLEEMMSLVRRASPDAQRAPRRVSA